MTPEGREGGVAHGQAASGQGVVLAELGPFTKAHVQHVRQQRVIRVLGHGEGRDEGRVVLRWVVVRVHEILGVVGEQGGLP